MLRYLAPALSLHRLLGFRERPFPKFVKMSYLGQELSLNFLLVNLRLSAKRIKVSPESLWIGGSRREVLALAGWTEKLGYLNTFET